MPNATPPSPDAILFNPPITEYSPETLLFFPPTAELYLPLTILSLPPDIVPDSAETKFV